MFFGLDIFRRTAARPRPTFHLPGFHTWQLAPLPSRRSFSCTRRRDGRTTQLSPEESLFTTVVAFFRPSHSDPLFRISQVGRVTLLAWVAIQSLWHENWPQKRPEMPFERDTYVCILHKLYKIIPKIGSVRMYCKIPHCMASFGLKNGQKISSKNRPTLLNCHPGSL